MSYSRYILPTVCVLAVLGGVWWWMRKSVQQSGEGITLPTPHPTAETLLPSPTVPPDWKSFSSSRLGVSLKYPSDMRTQSNQDGTVSFILLGETQTAATEMYDGISLTLQKGTYSAESFEEFVEKERETAINNPISDSVSDLREVQLAGKKGYAFMENAMGAYTHIYLQKDSNDYYHIVYMAPDPENKGYEETVMTILSSIKG